MDGSHQNVFHSTVKESYSYKYRYYLSLTAVGLNPASIYDNFSCAETQAIQLAYRTSVVLLRCPLMPETVHGGAT